MKLPNFFIVGAAKAGTTSLYQYLREHPDIYMPNNKENFFFSGIKKNTFTGTGSDYGQVIIEDFENYLKLFQNSINEKAVGEACVAYLYFYENTISNLKKYLKDALKIIIILRDPAERAFSNFRHHVRDNIEHLSFEQATRSDILRKRSEEKWWWGFQYVDVGFYYNQVKAYVNAFEKENVKIYLYDDLTENPTDMMRDIFKFLEVDDSLTPNTDVKHNVSQIRYNEPLNDFLIAYDHPIKRLLRPILLNSIGKENTKRLVNYIKHKNQLRMKSKTRKLLIDLYRDDIFKLEKLLKRDLSAWLK